MWMNDIKIATATSDADISDTNDTNPLLIGAIAYDSGLGNYFNGSIDELDIFNRAISDSEVDELYNNDNGLYGSTAWGPTASGLVAGYHFDEDGGNTISDYSGHGYDGTLYNGASLVPNNIATSMTAAYDVTNPTPGSNHLFTAVYSGDAKYAQSTSAAALIFTWTVPSAPAISTLGLSNVTNPTSTGGNPTSTDPTITGTIAGSGDAVANVPVEFYANRSLSRATPPRSGRALSDASGQFTFLPTGLSEAGGAITIWARTYISSPIAGQTAYGPATSCMFDFQAVILPAVASLSLQTVDATNNGTEEAGNPTLLGTISGTSDLSGVTIEFTNSATNVVLGFAQTDSSGKFTFSPTSLVPDSTITIVAAACVWDNNSKEYETGASQSITFLPLASTQPAATIGNLTGLWIRRTPRAARRRLPTQQLPGRSLAPPAPMASRSNSGTTAVTTHGSLMEPRRPMRRAISLIRQRTWRAGQRNPSGLESSNGTTRRGNTSKAR